MSDKICENTCNVIQIQETMGFSCLVGFFMGFKFLDDNFRGRDLCEPDCFV